MTKSQSVMGIVASLIISTLIIFAGSQESVTLFLIATPVVTEGLPLFAVCAPIGFILHWIAFLPSYTLKTDHYFDLTGSISYIATVIAVAMLSPSLDLRDLIICSMIIIWATRLGLFLFTRIKQDGKDVRLEIYTNVIKTKFIRFLNLWTLGGLWVLVTIGAGLAALTSKTSIELGVIGYIGIGLWLFGFIVEVVADSQKRQFKKDPANKNRFITTGIWSWSQHPNYFGEITLWLGVAVLAYPVLSGWQLATLISPIFVYLLLTKVSGIPLLDDLAKQKWGSDLDYLTYTQTTSKLILVPPNR
jgi:steroid 5-alpha reductase family enzyme|tara:strand:+ start:63 stop:971 length:909 start_codon:yes stop_codon:yes gene_type:complete